MFWIVLGGFQRPTQQVFGCLGLQACLPVIPNVEDPCEFGFPLTSPQALQAFLGFQTHQVFLFWSVLGTGCIWKFAACRTANKQSKSIESQGLEKLIPFFSNLLQPDAKAAFLQIADGFLLCRDEI